MSNCEFERCLSFLNGQECDECVRNKRFKDNLKTLYNRPCAKMFCKYNESGKCGEVMGDEVLVNCDKFAIT